MPLSRTVVWAFGVGLLAACGPAPSIPDPTVVPAGSQTPAPEFLTQDPLPALLIKLSQGTTTAGSLGSLPARFGVMDLSVGSELPGDQWLAASDKLASTASHVLGDKVLLPKTDDVTTSLDSACKVAKALDLPGLLLVYDRTYAYQPNTLSIGVFDWLAGNELWAAKSDLDCLVVAVDGQHLVDRHVLQGTAPQRQAIKGQTAYQALLREAAEDAWSQLGAYLNDHLRTGTVPATTTGSATAAAKP